METERETERQRELPFSSMLLHALSTQANGDAGRRSGLSCLSDEVMTGQRNVTAPSRSRYCSFLNFPEDLCATVGNTLCQLLVRVPGSRV